MTPPLMRTTSGTEVARVQGDVGDEATDGGRRRNFALEAQLVREQRAEAGEALLRTPSHVEESSCGVCCDVMVDPATLPCGHAFCLACIRRWVARAGSASATCPQCRVAVTSAQCTVDAVLSARLRNNLGEAMYAARASEASSVVERLVEKLGETDSGERRAAVEALAGLGG
eukprot:CAMPEP_0170136628 /NCGR_PEP_ID=MMETSP0033_2-20121228/3476_1 /TAXON_ID=195969 /ORGANISM="Dolichomastix tenuilepis, Strain CCMP3274" /LENGTH=171 /DNA_ID=CAMNT_0010372383 /DNA_START=204 /DNA_END=716 /DNA_ORIENTATION=-